ncbi:hypothetical protein M601_003985 [Cellulophaga baltica 4]|nr:hypothetical protein M601_003985 [Cellulophaga baltica 4]
MKNTISLSILLVSIFMTLSCSSDDNSETPDVIVIDLKQLVKTEKKNETFKSDYSYNSEDILTNWTGIHPNFSYVVDFAYNADGNIILETYELTTDETITTETIYEYDSNGNLTRYNDMNLTYNGATINATGTTRGFEDIDIQLEVNADGLVTKLSEPDNYQVFEYDTSGNLIGFNNYDNNDILLNTFSLSYDQSNNPFLGQLKSLYIQRFITTFFPAPTNGIYIGGIDGYRFPYLKNNIVTISENEEIIATTTYNYNSENNPMNVNEEYFGESFLYDIAYYN